MSQNGETWGEGGLKLRRDKERARIWSGKQWKGEEKKQIAK